MVEKMKLGIVLGGGGAKCFAHLPLLEKLEKENIPIDYITAGSSGCLLAALWSLGYRRQEIKNLFLGKKRKWYSFRITKRGIIKPKALDILKESLTDKKFSDLKIPCSFVLHNYSKGDEVVIEEGNLADHIYDSCCFPGIFIPRKEQGDLILDGGVTNLVPADLAREKVGSEGIVISQILTGHFDGREKALSNPFKLLIRGILIALEYRKREITNKHSDIILEPFKDLHFNLRFLKHSWQFFNEEKIDDYLRRGEEELANKWPEVEKLIR